MMQPAVPVGCIMTVGCTARVDLGGVHARPAMVAPVGPVVGAGANPTAMVSPPSLTGCACDRILHAAGADGAVSAYRRTV